MTITWKIGGEAGFGIMTTGVMFSRLAIRHGYNIFDYIEYPSLIRGGHNIYEVCVSDEEVYSQEKQANLLFALNQETVNLHKDNIKSGGLLAYDPDNVKVDNEELANKNLVLYPIPFVKLTREAGALKVMENNVALGASAALLSMDISVLCRLIADTFRGKGEQIIKSNQSAAQVGYDYVINNPPQEYKCKLEKKPLAKQQIVVTGNEAAVLGAISSGCKFYTAYPMTPTSGALAYMADIGAKNGVVVKHAEDEISVINMAIGASYAGVRSMMGTAGGGFSLMVEGLGLAGITETPIVILMGQRPGPATGMPTWTCQGDLKFLVNSSQDEFLRIILAPGDQEEMFYLTQEAFNLADIYQTPVFILTDKYLAESHKSVPVYDTKKIPINRGQIINWDNEKAQSDYLRYKTTNDGIAERAFPGMKNLLFTANSYEHDEYGFSTENSLERIKQVDRRNKKMETYKKTIPQQKIYGGENTDLLLVGWGSTKGPVLEALKRLKTDNFKYKISYLHITHVWPLPAEFVSQTLKKYSRICLIEGNSQAQLGSIIREQTGLSIENKFLRYDGRPFYPEDIILKIKEIVK